MYIRQNITSMELGIKIKKIRESKNYTQEYMSNKLNISQNTYSKIESGGIKLTVDRLKKYQKYWMFQLRIFLIMSLRFLIFTIVTLISFMVISKLFTKTTKSYFKQPLSY